MAGHGIAGTVRENVGIVIDKGAFRAMNRGCGLLPAGIHGVRGQFEAGEPISILNAELRKVGVGLSEYNSDEVEAIQERHSSQIAELCGRYRGANVFRKWAFALTAEYSAQ
jgi:glutamate 5-kinase